MPPRPRITHQKGGERSNAAAAQAVRRQSTVTRAPRSRARLLPVTKRRDPWRSHVHRTCTAQRVQPFKLQTRNVGGRGGRPSPFSGGSKGGILFGKRIPPLSGSSAKSCTINAAPAGAAFPAPSQGGIKRDALFRAQKKSRPSDDSHFLLD